MAERFKYQPQWEGPLPGPSFEKQTEDAINGLWDAIDNIGGAVPSDDLPQAPGTAKCLPLMREVAFAKQKTEGENLFSLPQSALLTAPSSEGADYIVSLPF